MSDVGLALVAVLVVGLYAAHVWGGLSGEILSGSYVGICVALFVVILLDAIEVGETDE